MSGRAVVSRPCLPAAPAYVPDGKDRLAHRRMSMTTSYWIAHPQRIAFISAFSPEGLGQLLEVAEDWPAGRYAIRIHRHGEAEAADDHGIREIAVKDASGDVWIEPE